MLRQCCPPVMTCACSPGNDAALKAARPNTAAPKRRVSVISFRPAALAAGVCVLQVTSNGNLDRLNSLPPPFSFSSPLAPLSPSAAAFSRAVAAALWLNSHGRQGSVISWL